MNDKGNSKFRFHIGPSKTELSRRHFIRRATGALGMTAAATLGGLNRVRRASAAYSPTDYKAIVCVFLRGGCDMNNLIIPVKDNDQADDYKQDRGGAAIPEYVSEERQSNGQPANGEDDPDGNQLVRSLERQYGDPDYVITSQGSLHKSKLPAPAAGKNHDEYALHPSCSKMKSMYDQGRLALVCNVATLAEDTTVDTYGDSVLPVQLFSHSNQVNEHMSGNAAAPFTSGWAGRVANHFFDDMGTLRTFDDFWNNPATSSSRASMLVTVGGGNDWMVTPGGSSIQQYQVNNNGAVDVNFAIDEDRYFQMHGIGKNAESGFNNYRNVLRRGYVDKVKLADLNRALIGQATAVADGLSMSPSIDQIFTNHGANTNLGNELKMICKLIAGREELDNTRQIFFCDLGGFDNHSNINNNQPNLFTQVSNAVAAFDEAMQAIDAAEGGSGIYEQVLGFQMSDFNRTWTPNGGNIVTNPAIYGTLGTDHAWGSHSFAWGGPVLQQQPSGGSLYGFFPHLEVNGLSDVPGNNNRGRWIPSTPVEGVGARVANWFGVATADMGQVFPNLAPESDAYAVKPWEPAANLDFVPLV